MSEVDRMDLLRHWRITVCPRCDVQIGGGGHCWECGSRGVKPVPRSVEVEVVPAPTRGAVSAGDYMLREQELATAVDLLRRAMMQTTWDNLTAEIQTFIEAIDTPPTRGAVSPADMLAEAARLITLAGQHPEAQGVGLSFSYEGLADQVRDQEQSHRQAMAWRAEQGEKP